jgi:protein-S-isoprenylcysteine O-methyltransferase Ste14
MKSSTAGTSGSTKSSAWKDNKKEVFGPLFLTSKSDTLVSSLVCVSPDKLVYRRRSVACRWREIMSIYVIILIVLPLIWIGFEFSLIVQDNRQNKGKTKDDKGTRTINFLSLALGIGLAAAVNGLTLFFFPGGRTVPGFIAGILLIILGMGLRVWSILTLGFFFRTTIETNIGQKVITSGPYKLIRHPSYAGWLIICLGYGVAMQNWLSLLFAFCLPLAALLHRIHIEEQLLVSTLGQDYVNYQKCTKKLVPWIW